jgi:hypothetical protein
MKTSQKYISDFLKVGKIVTPHRKLQHLIYDCAEIWSVHYTVCTQGIKTCEGTRAIVRLFHYTYNKRVKTGTPIQ